MKPVELSSAFTRGKDFIASVEAASGVNLRDCYQCGKCSAGCPAAFAMDYTPRQVIRLVQLGLKDEVLASHAIWLCAGCENCSTRCPRDIELPKVMDALRAEARKVGIVAERNVNLFNDLFLQSVESNGRVHEFGLVLNFNLKSKQLFKDAAAGPEMMKRGKLSLLPEKIRDTEAVKRIFANARRLGGERH